MGPPCCRPAGKLLAWLKAAERNILPHRGLGEPALGPDLRVDLRAVTEGRTMRTTAGDGFHELWRYPRHRATIHKHLGKEEGEHQHEDEEC